MLLVIIGICPASASYISLNTTVTSKVEKDSLKVTVSTVNKGDESARNVQAEIRVGEDKYLDEKREEIGVNQIYTASAVYDLKNKKPGQYPLLIIMHYADANQYPFSALNAQTFSYKAKDLPSEIFGKIRTSTFWKKGKVELTLKNMGDSELSVSTKIIVPRELTVEKDSQENDIPSKSEKRLSFAVENFSALSGSSYQVFAVSEYEKDGLHRTSITPGMVKIEESRQILGISYTAVIVFIILLLFIFIVAQLYGKK